MFTTIKEAVDNFNNWEVCNSVLWAKTSEKSYKISNENLEEGYIPIGLYVVPESHTNDRLHRFMSLKYMNYTTPNSGSTNYQGICWGNCENKIHELSNFNKVNIYNDDPEYFVINAKHNDVTIDSKLVVVGGAQELLKTSTWGYLPSDKFSSSTLDNINSAFKYYSTGVKDKIPCPYGLNDLLNPLFNTIKLSPKNALADMNGNSNTDILVKYAFNQSNWKTSSQIINNSEAGYSSAACCCKRYNPDGFTQGIWYLPACGELAYVCVKQKAINNKLSALRTNYSAYCFASLATYWFWSSTSYSDDRAYYVYFDYGRVHWSDRYNSYYVLSFLSA